MTILRNFQVIPEPPTPAPGPCITGGEICYEGSTGALSACCDGLECIPIGINGYCINQ